MSNIITGGLAAAMALTYLLYYAIRLHSVPLWIIILANMAALIYDYVSSIRKGEDLI